MDDETAHVCALTSCGILLCVLVAVEIATAISIVALRFYHVDDWTGLW